MDVYDDDVRVRPGPSPQTITHLCHKPPTRPHLPSYSLSLKQIVKPHVQIYNTYTLTKYWWIRLYRGNTTSELVLSLDAGRPVRWEMTLPALIYARSLSTDGRLHMWVITRSNQPLVLCENDIEEYATVFCRLTILINDHWEPRKRQAPLKLILVCKWPRETAGDPWWKDSRDNSSRCMRRGAGLTLLKIITIIGSFLASQENQDKSGLSTALSAERRLSTANVWLDGFVRLSSLWNDGVWDTFRSHISHCVKNSIKWMHEIALIQIQYVSVLMNL